MDTVLLYFVGKVYKTLKELEVAREELLAIDRNYRNYCDDQIDITDDKGDLYIFLPLRLGAQLVECALNEDDANVRMVFDEDHVPFLILKREIKTGDALKYSYTSEGLPKEMIQEIEERLAKEDRKRKEVEEAFASL